VSLNASVDGPSKGKKTIRLYVSPVNKFFKRYKEFQKIEKEKAKERESTEFTKSMDTLIGEKLQKEGFRGPVDRSKWVSKDGFRTIFGIATTSRGFSNT